MVTSFDAVSSFLPLKTCEFKELLMPTYLGTYYYEIKYVGPNQANIVFSLIWCFVGFKLLHIYLQMI